jgi:glycosyltransferase involved in cell wall biosynthesis
MKILLCKGQFQGPVSGADEILVNYATQLRSSEISVSVLLLYPYLSPDHYYRRLLQAGVPVRVVASRPVGTFLGAGRKLALHLLKTFPTSQRFLRNMAERISNGIASRYQQQCAELLKELRADIVHVLTPDAAAMIVIKAAHDVGIPVIYQEVGIPYHPPDFEPYYEQFTTVLPLCAEVAALSPALAQQCRQRLPNSKTISVLPLITTDLRNGGSAARAASTDINVGFAARIEHLKRPMILLEAFAIVSRVCDRLRLKIAGAGSQEQKLKARAHDLGVLSRCEFRGVYTTLEQRRDFMASLDIFALPSLTEGTPNSIIEAMSHGVPVIASAVGGIPDVLTSESGVLVSPSDVTALAEAIIRLAEDVELRRRMGQAARERYEQLFSPEVVLPILLNTYRRVIAGETSSAATLLKELGAHPWGETSAPLNTSASLPDWKRWAAS